MPAVAMFLQGSSDHEPADTGLQDLRISAGSTHMYARFRVAVFRCAWLGVRSSAAERSRSPFWLLGCM